MDATHISELKEDWERVLTLLESQFEEKPDLQAIIFLVGVQELGQGSRKFSKDEKQDLMHISTCKLMSYYGYYELTGQDDEGWPQWELVKKLPSLTLKEQDLLLRQSVIQYFKEQDLLT